MDPTEALTRKTIPDALDDDADAIDDVKKNLDAVIPHGVTLAKIGSGMRRLVVTSNGREIGERLTFAIWEYDEFERLLPVPRSAVTARAGDLPALARALAAAMRRARASADATRARDRQIAAHKAHAERRAETVDTSPECATPSTPTEKP